MKEPPSSTTIGFSSARKWDRPYISRVLYDQAGMLLVDKHVLIERMFEVPVEPGSPALRQWNGKLRAYKLETLTRMKRVLFIIERSFIQEHVAFPYYWRVRTRLPWRFGKRCRVLARGKKNTALIEFTDGCRVTTSRNYIRKVAISDE